MPWRPPAEPAWPPGGREYREVLCGRRHAERPDGTLFATGEFLNHMVPAHLWFFWYLLCASG